MRRALVLITLIFLTCASKAQRIEDFDLYQSETTVVIKFNVTPGVACSGFSVLHSLDSMNYELLFTDPGICGNQPYKEVKTYTHPNPSSGQTHFYRVRLEPYVELTEPKSIYVEAPADKELRVFPNPQYPGMEWLYFRIPDNTQTQLIATVYDYSGHEFGNRELVLRNGHWGLSTQDLNSGIFFVRFSNYLKGRSFKFVVLR